MPRCPQMRIDRRRFMAISALAAVNVVAGRAAADDAHQFPLKGDDGSSLPNYRLPSQLGTDDLGSVLWAGSSSPDAVLVEFFDYNCPFCRRAVKDIDALVERDGDFRLGLVNNAIISAGSVQAAKVMLAILKLSGPKTAYRFHLKLLGSHGPVDGQAALKLAGDMGLDRKLIESTGDAAARGCAPPADRARCLARLHRDALLHDRRRRYTRLSGTQGHEPHRHVRAQMREGRVRVALRGALWRDDRPATPRLPSRPINPPAAPHRGDAAASHRAKGRRGPCRS
jgi:protein-disulfide isomerase